MNVSLNKQIGMRIRIKREDLGYTREELCCRVNISSQFLSEVERGKKGVSTETLYNLCEELGTSADYVLMGRENLTDISKMVKLFATIDEKYITLAEDLLKAYFKSITLK